MGFDRDRLPDPVTYYESQGYKLVGPRSAPWRTTECRFHGGSDSMRVNVSTGAFRCMNCGARGGDILHFHIATSGQDFRTAAMALGAWKENGKSFKPERPSTLSPRSALQLVAFEVTLAAVISGNLARGIVLSDTDRKRLRVCAGRINHVAGEFSA